MLIHFTMYRCDECREETMVPNEDVLKSKLDGWLTITIDVTNAGGHTRHFCSACAKVMLKHYTGRPTPEARDAPPAEAPTHGTFHEPH